jgi:hypothetical protein
MGPCALARAACARRVSPCSVWGAIPLGPGHARVGLVSVSWTRLRRRSHTAHSTQHTAHSAQHPSRQPRPEGARPPMPMPVPCPAPALRQHGSSPNNQRLPRPLQSVSPWPWPSPSGYTAICQPCTPTCPAAFANTRARGLPGLCSALGEWRGRCQQCWRRATQRGTRPRAHADGTVDV